MISKRFELLVSFQGLSAWFHLYSTKMSSKDMDSAIYNNIRLTWKVFEKLRNIAKIQNFFWSVWAIGSCQRLSIWLTRRIRKSQRKNNWRAIFTISSDICLLIVIFSYFSSEITYITFGKKGWNNLDYTLK